MIDASTERGHNHGRAPRALARSDRRLARDRGRCRVLHLHLRPTPAEPALPEHDARPAATPARTCGSRRTCETTCSSWRRGGVDRRLVRGVPCRPVLLPVPRAPDRPARHRPPVQHRVQARHRARSGAACRSAAYVFARGHPRAPSRACVVRRRRDRLPVLQGRRRLDHAVRPPHHGRDAHEHARGRVLVHDRGRVRAVLPRHARVALDRRGSLWVPALFLAATLTSHLVVGVFAFYGAIVIWLFRRPIKSTARAVAIGAVGVALTAVWLVPLAATSRTRPTCATNRWEHRVHQPWLLGRLLGIRCRPRSTGCSCRRCGTCSCFALVAIGAGIAYRRRRHARSIAHDRVRSPARVFCGWELLRDIFGKAPAWNLRLLPFWYLMLYLLAALGAAELARWAGSSPLGWRTDPVAATATERRGRQRKPRVRRRGRVIEPLVTVRGDLASPSRVHPWWSTVHGGRARPRQRDQAATSRTGPSTTTRVTRAAAPPTARRRPTPSTGVHGHRRRAPAGAHAVGTGLRRSARTARRSRSCCCRTGPTGASARWRPLLRVGRRRRAYHFLAAATLTPTPSNAVRGLPYRTSADFDLGVRYLQLLGVRYYAAMPDMQAAAATQPVAPRGGHGARPRPGSTQRLEDLRGRRLAPSSSRCRYEPVVARNVQLRRELEVRGQARSRRRARPGVAELSRVGVPRGAVVRRPRRARPAAHRRRARRAGSEPTCRRARRSPRSRCRACRSATSDRPTTPIEFDVSRTGVPVMVKTSYFPNWEAQRRRRARGGRRPNFMVVVPTSRHVQLSHYGSASGRAAGWARGRVGGRWRGLGSALGRRSGLGGARRSRLRRDPPDTGEAATSGTEAGAIPSEAAPTAGTISVPLRAVRTRGSPVADAALDSIFKAYDIRGIYPDELDESVARAGRERARRLHRRRAACSSATTPGRRPSRSSPRSSTARRSPGPTCSTSGIASTDLCYFAAGRPRRARQR